MLRLLRLPFWAYLIAAPLVLAFGIYFYIDDSRTEAAKALARSQQPPAEIAIEKFDAKRDVGPANEVQIVGQVDLAHMMELTETKRGLERNRWNVAPIYPASATDTSAAAIGVFEQHGTISDAQLAGMIVGQGAFGPIMRINGEMTTDYKAQEAVRKALERTALAPNAVIVDPFEGGRVAGLAEKTEGPIIAGVIVILGLLLAGYGWFLRARRRAAEERAHAEVEPTEAA